MMNACKCFLNDQLLPVRAGCEAIYCKDVESGTAIREEALSRLADLQRQLQQAQEERDRQKRFAEEQMDMATKLMFEAAGLRTQRDAAIEQGEAAERRMDGWATAMRQANQITAEQRALALRVYKVCKHTLEGDRSPEWYKMVVFDLGQLTRPAEALRAEHRSDRDRTPSTESPQSGQARQEKSDEVD